LALQNRFRGTHLLVVGDLILDRFIWGSVERISPEAPVPVLRVNSENFRLGGAANVVHNIRSLGARVTACGVVGQDEAGRRLLGELKKIGSSSGRIVVARGFPTTQKTRVIASPRHQQIVRLDRENDREMDRRWLRDLRESVRRHAPACDGIVVSDYGKGVVHPELLEVIAELAEQKGLMCVMDPKKENFKYYRNATLVTPNKEEASVASGIEIRDDVSLRAAGEKLLTLWQARAVLITRGPEGMSLYRRDGASGHFPTAAKEVFDVTGAGDTVVATCALALASRAAYEEAAILANLAAGIVVGEVGTAAVTSAQLKTVIQADSWTGGRPKPVVRRPRRMPAV
jgi:D-beta-D-heptose 7-phosphate kinase/D-beta-D-heptose 1-phosphate adenosyltransferase